MLIMNYLLGAVDLWVMVQRKWRSVMAGCILMAPPGVVLPQLHGADSTIYTVFPEAIITALSTKTLHGQGLTIPAGVDSAVLVLSSDGNTLYVVADGANLRQRPDYRRGLPERQDAPYLPHEVSYLESGHSCPGAKPIPDLR